MFFETRTTSGGSSRVQILLEDYMKPMGLSQNALARALDVPPRRINEIIHNTYASLLDAARMALSSNSP